MELLYRKSLEGKSILRNQNHVVSWVADYLNFGKPQKLVEHAQSKRLKGTIPPVLRPDLLWTENGFVMTELDSVPGGIGLTALLNRIYDTEEAPVIGNEDKMLDYFYESLLKLCPRVTRESIYRNRRKR